MAVFSSSESSRPAGPVADPASAAEDTPEELSPTASAMMPPLPRPDEPVMPERGASFEDRVLLLLAAVVLADGMLTYPEYELAESVVRRIFGERALHAGMQARFHHALLNPPEHPEELAASLAAEAVVEQVSAEQVRALLAGLEELCRRREHADAVARRLREAIDIAFAAERLERRRRHLARESGLMDGLEQGARLGVQVGAKMGKVAVGGTLQLVQGVFDAALSVLPGRGQGQDVALRDEMLTPPVAAFNAALAVGVDGLARAAWTLGDDELQRQLADFRRILADQPFRVVLVGEGKRGKSSLVNALLGDELSPVRESVPETAAVAEFFHAPQPRYAVRFLDEEQFAHLADYLAGEEDNLLLRDKVEALRQTAADSRPRGLVSLASRAGIPDYLAVDGRYSALTARVFIGLPVDILRSGMVVVDTPGLNATDSFQDYLAYEESLTADCLVFVMDARRPDSASELRLLRKLAATGRAVSIIGVLTGVDRLNEADSREEAAARALAILREACRGAEGLRVLGLVALNAREAMAARVGTASGRPADRRTVRELGRLFDLLRTAMAADDSKTDYRTRVAARRDQLVALARERCGAAMERYRATLPPPQFLELLERHADQLAAAALSHREQARSVVAAAAHDVDEWSVARQRALDAWEELLTLRVMEAAHRHADALGADFAKESAWKSFDEEEAPRIARQCLDEFLAGQQDILRGWEEKLRLFGDDMRELSVLCLNTVEESAGELGDICAVTGRMDHLLVQSDAHMRRLAVFLGGAGAGAALTGGLFNLVAWGGAALMVLSHPLALPGVALVGAAAYALHAMGNPERRKAAWLERKRKKTAQWATEARKKLEEELRAAGEELTAAYKTAVSRGFVPALEILVSEAVHLRLYLQVMDRIQEDADNLDRSMEHSVRRLEETSYGPSTAG